MEAVSRSPFRIRSGDGKAPRRLTIAVGASAALLWFGAAGARAQTAMAAQRADTSSAAQPNNGGGVLEIAPQTPPSSPPEAQPAPPAEDGSNQATDNDIELYRTYTGSEHTRGHSGPLPYLGISVHSTTVTEPGGNQQRALEVLSVDRGSPAAAAGIRGSGTPTKLGASSLTASAMLGPAQELLAPLLKKTGQLGRQGDLIVAADDNRVGSEEELAAELAKLKPGDTIWLTVLRESAKGKPHAVKVPIRLGPPQSAASR
jgi:hypothetical protein